MDKPLPAFWISWHLNTQGKWRNKGEKLLSLNNLPSFIQNGCVICSIESEEGTKARLGPLWKMLNKMGILHQIFGWKVVMVVLFCGNQPSPTKPQYNAYVGALLSTLTLSHPKFFLSLR
jgi:hypothetical protein